MSALPIQVYRFSAATFLLQEGMNRIQGYDVRLGPAPSWETRNPRKFDGGATPRDSGKARLAFLYPVSTT